MPKVEVPDTGLCATLYACGSPQHYLDLVHPAETEAWISQGSFSSRYALELKPLS